MAPEKQKTTAQNRGWQSARAHWLLPRLEESARCRRPFRSKGFCDCSAAGNRAKNGLGKPLLTVAGQRRTYTGLPQTRKDKIFDLTRRNGRAAFHCRLKMLARQGEFFGCGIDIPHQFSRAALASFAFQRRQNFVRHRVSGVDDADLNIRLAPAVKIAAAAA